MPLAPDLATALDYMDSRQLSNVKTNRQDTEFLLFEPNVVLNGEVNPVRVQFLNDIVHAISRLDKFYSQ